MKTCTTCKLDKNFSSFARKGPDKLQAKCKDCNSAYNREHYKSNKAKYVTDNRERRRKTADWYRSYKSTLSCTQCGENHPATIDFHHIDGNKEEAVAHVRRGASSPAKILKEIAKCVVLCSNCHRKLHWNERNTLA